MERFQFLFNSRVALSSLISPDNNLIKERRAGIRCFGASSPSSPSSSPLSPLCVLSTLCCPLFLPHPAVRFKSLPNPPFCSFLAHRLVLDVVSTFLFLLLSPHSFCTSVDDGFLLCCLLESCLSSELCRNAEDEMAFMFVQGLKTTL